MHTHTLYNCTCINVIPRTWRRNKNKFAQDYWGSVRRHCVSETTTVYIVTIYTIRSIHNILYCVLIFVHNIFSIYFSVKSHDGEEKCFWKVLKLQNRFYHPFYDALTTLRLSYSKMYWVWIRRRTLFSTCYE